MKRRRFVNLRCGRTRTHADCSGGGFAVLSQNVAAQGRGGQAPRLDVDPLWPKPFPVEKHWALGSVTGVAVDAQDHIWVSNRGTDSLQNNEKGPTLTPWASECCFGAPQILEFDAAGTLLNSWGGPGQGYQWPQNPAGIAVDAKGQRLDCRGRLSGGAGWSRPRPSTGRSCRTGWRRGRGRRARRRSRRTGWWRALLRRLAPPAGVADRRLPPDRLTRT